MRTKRLKNACFLAKSRSAFLAASQIPKCLLFYVNKDVISIKTSMLALTAAPSWLSHTSVLCHSSAVFNIEYHKCVFRHQSCAPQLQATFEWNHQSATLRRVGDGGLFIDRICQRTWYTQKCFAGAENIHMWLIEVFARI